MLIRMLACVATALLNAGAWLVLNEVLLGLNPAAVGGVVFGLTFVVMLFLAGAKMVNPEQ